MEPAIVAALVAGVVSLAGILINLVIAKQAREANRDQIRLGAAIRAGEEAVKALAAQTVEVERLRIACWDIHGLLQELEEADSALQSEFFLRKLASAAEGFEERYGTFVNFWAEAKGEVPQPQVVYLRSLRHQCKNVALTISSELHFLPDLAKKEKGRDILGAIRRIELNIERLLEMLDKLFSAVNSVRAQRIESVFLALDPAVGERAHNSSAAPDVNRASRGRRR